MKKQINSIIEKEFNCQVKETDRLIDLGIESMDRIILAAELEKEFNISISDEEMESWYNVQDIYYTIFKLTKLD